MKQNYINTIGDQVKQVQMFNYVKTILKRVSEMIDVMKNKAIQGYYVSNVFIKKNLS